MAIGVRPHIARLVSDKPGLEKISRAPLEAWFPSPKSLPVEAIRLGERPVAPAVVPMLLYGECGYADF